MNNGWQQRYAEKILPAPAAIQKVKPGDRVFIGSACGAPQALVRAMAECADALVDTEVVNVLSLGLAPYADARFAQSFRMNTFFIGAAVREAVNEARADYTPVFLTKVPALFHSRQIDLDVALIQVSPPDRHGYCSLGVSVDITKAAAESARLVIAQVNAHMPRVLGDSFLHVSQIDYLVPQDEPLLEWPALEDHDGVTRQIAENVARLVPDGATLQLGIGRIPDAVLACLTDKHDLGIHTEMISDGVMKLAQAGVITGRRKSLHTGKIVGTFAAGSQQLFAFLDNNPQIEMHPSDYTNDPLVISRHDNMVAINGALEVDLTGQVAADSLGQEFYSGIGGHADFMRGAGMSKGGKAIVIFPSTARQGSGVRSRITASLQSGAGVTSTRGDVHYAVTEYGIAYLHGKTMRERALALIGIAHPDFRAELLHAAKRRRLVYLNQILPPPKKPYPAQYESTAVLRDGTRIRLRPIRPEDEPLMKEMFYSFTQQTVYLRFHSIVKSMPHERLQLFCTVDYDTEMALVAVTGSLGQEEIVGMARYLTDPSRESAELAFVVRDPWQRKGLGTIMFERLIEIGKQNGIRKFWADVLVENSGMLKIFHRSGLETESTTEGNVVRVTMTLPEKQPEPK